MRKKKEKEIKALKLRKVKSTKKRVKKLNKAVKPVDKERSKTPSSVYYIPRANLFNAFMNVYPLFKDFAIDSKCKTNIDNVRLNVDAFVVMDGAMYADTIGISMDYTLVIKIPKDVYSAIHISNFKTKKTIKMKFFNDEYCLERNISTLMAVMGSDDARHFDSKGTLNDTFPHVDAKIILPADKNYITRRVNVMSIASKIYFKDENGKKVKDIVVL